MLAKSLLAVAAITAASVAIPIQAKADLIYTFEQKSSSHAWYTQGIEDLDTSQFHMSAQLRLTDEAINGFSLDVSINNPGGTVLRLNQVLGFTVSMFSGDRLMMSWDLPYMTALISEGSTPPRFLISLVGGAGLGVMGNMTLNNTSHDITSIFTGPDFYGSFGSDDGLTYGCYFSRCLFSGHNSLSPVAVPEPGSLALLGTGLLGVAYTQFRRSGRRSRSALAISA